MNNDDRQALLLRTCLNEGFKDKPYQDHLGIWTIGHGLTYITPAESREITRLRLLGLENNLLVRYRFLLEAPSPVVSVLVEMAYQMGLTGLNGFVKMLTAIELGDYETAAFEGLDSKWAKQTPNRANRLMAIVRGEAK